MKSNILGEVYIILLSPAFTEMFFIVTSKAKKVQGHGHCHIYIELSKCILVYVRVKVRNSFNRFTFEEFSIKNVKS